MRRRCGDDADCRGLATSWKRSARGSDFELATVIAARARRLGGKLRVIAAERFCRVDGFNVVIIVRAGRLGGKLGVSHKIGFAELTASTS